MCKSLLISGLGLGNLKYKIYRYVKLNYIIVSTSLTIQ